jgi:hypothetical protein
MKNLSKKWHTFIDNPPTLTLVKLTAIFLLLVVVLATMVNADSYLNLRNLAATGVSTSSTATSTTRTCLTTSEKSSIQTSVFSKNLNRAIASNELSILSTSTLSTTTQAQLNTLNTSLTAKAAEISTYTAQYTYYYNLRNGLRKPKPGSTAIQLGTYKKYYDLYNGYYTTYANYYYAAKASYDSIKAQIDALTPRVSATTTARIATLNTQITTLTAEISALNTQLKLPACTTSGGSTGGGSNTYVPDTGSHALCSDDTECTTGETCKSSMCVTEGSDVCSNDSDCQSGDQCNAAHCEASSSGGSGTASSTQSGMCGQYPIGYYGQQIENIVPESQCCFDSIDNDYDYLVDHYDPDCSGFYEITTCPEQIDYMHNIADVVNEFLRKILQSDDELYNQFRSEGQTAAEAYENVRKYKEEVTKRYNEACETYMSQLDNISDDLYDKCKLDFKIQQNPCS